MVRGSDRILLASRAVWFYAGKLLWPFNLMFSYPRWTIAAADPRAYLWPAATVAFGAVVCLRSPVGRSLEAAVLFYVATLSPVLGFIMLYTFYYSFVADHYQYVASIGIIALVSAGAADVTGSFTRRPAWLETALCLSLLLVLGTLSWRRASVYLSAETLWTDTAQKNPDSWLAHNNLANVLERRGNLDEAIAHYRSVLQIKPDYAVAHFNLGNALMATRHWEEAIDHFRMALRITPDYLRAQSNLAFVLATAPRASLRDGVEAVALPERSNQRAGGDNVIALRVLAAAYAEAGRRDDAVRSAHRALELARAAEQSEMVTLLSGELTLYVAGLPYHQAGN